MHNSKICCTFAPILSITESVLGVDVLPLRNGRAFYFVSFFRFYVVNMIKKSKKIKKNTKK